MTVDGYGFSFWGDENVQESDMVMDAQHCEYTKNTELHTLKNVNFMGM